MEEPGPGSGRGRFRGRAPLRGPATHRSRRDVRVTPPLLKRLIARPRSRDRVSASETVLHFVRLHRPGALGNSDSLSSLNLGKRNWNS